MASSDGSGGIGQPSTGLEPILARLGKAPDQQLAREVGLDPRRVKHARESLRIPPYDRMRPLLPYLGKVPDRRLARRFGVSEPTVRRRRQKLGIAPADVKRYNAGLLVRQYVAALERES